MPVLKTQAEGVTCRGGRILAGQRIEQPVHRRILGLVLHRRTAAFLLEPDRFFDQVAGDLLHIAADIADFGELGRLDLHERRVSELCQTSADLGLAAARGADHQDVLGRHFLAQFRRELLTPPAVAHGNGNGALGIGLADNVFVEGGHNGLGGEGVVHRDFRLSRAKSRDLGR